jgi:hypothetical protein
MSDDKSLKPYPVQKGGAATEEKGWTIANAREALRTTQTAQPPASQPNTEPAKTDKPK